MTGDTARARHHARVRTATTAGWSEAGASVAGMNQSTSAGAPSPAGTPSGISVRAARDAELDQAGDAVRAAYQADGHGVGDYLDVIADARTRARDAEIAVAVDPLGRITGSVTLVGAGSAWAELAQAPGDTEIRMLGVRPEDRGRGIGRALMEWCIEHARELGARRLLLATQPTMTAAHRVYDQLGFTRRPELDFSPVPRVHLLAFELPLSAQADPPPGPNR